MKLLKSQIAKYPLLSHDEEKMLLQAWALEKSPAVRDKLVAHNLRLILWAAKKLGCEYNEDLMAEGAIGLVKGIEKFDITRGVKLSTYVGEYVQAYMLNAIAKNGYFRPKSKKERAVFWRIKKISKSLEDKGVEVTPESIAEAMDVDTATVVRIQGSTKAVVSINVPVSKFTETNNKMSDFIISEEPLPDDQFEQVEENIKAKRLVSEFMKTLNPVEKLIMKNRLLEEKSLEDVSNLVGMTKEGVRQHQIKLEKKLRGMKQNQVFRERRDLKYKEE